MWTGPGLNPGQMDSEEFTAMLPLYRTGDMHGRDTA